MRPSWKVLRDARLAGGLTQAEVAFAAGVTQAAIAQMERPGSNPTVRSLSAALRATGHQLTLEAHTSTPNVDESLIARNLRLSPGERLIAFERAHAETNTLRGLIAHDVAG